MDENYGEYQDGQRKSRFNFTMDRDLLLLRAVIRLNPYLYGKNRWQEALNVFKVRGHDVTLRTLQSRIKILRQQHRHNQFSKLKTGTEDQQRKRAELLQNLEEMIEASSGVYDAFNNESEESLVMAVSHYEDDDNSRVTVKDEKIHIEGHKGDHEYTTNKEYHRPHKRYMYLNNENEATIKKARTDDAVLERIRSEEAKERRFYEERKRKDDIMMKQLQIQSELVEHNKSNTDAFAQ